MRNTVQLQVRATFFLVTCFDLKYLLNRYWILTLAFTRFFFYIDYFWVDFEHLVLAFAELLFNEIKHRFYISLSSSMLSDKSEAPGLSNFYHCNMLRFKKCITQISNQLLWTVLHLYLDTYLLNFLTIEH